MTPLTPDQLMILRALAAGLDRQEAATVLDLPLETVKAQLKVIYRVLGAKTAGHAVAQGFRQGLLT